MIARRARRTGRKNYVRDSAAGTIKIVPRDRLLERSPATVPPFAALREIHHKLAVRTEQFEAHGDSGRSGVYFAIIDVCNFFESQGIPIATLAPLTAVAAAIIDADRGTANPIFKPDRQSRGGKPATSINQLTSDGHIATVVECCVRHCKAEGHRPYVERGCRLAQSMIRQSAWPFDPSVVELRELRERLQASSKRSPDRIAYDALMSIALIEVDPLTVAKALLRSQLVPSPPA